MRLSKKQKELVQGLIKGKGYFKTPKVPKDKDDKLLDVMLPLYLKGVFIFQREYIYTIIHKVTHKHYVLTSQWDKKTLKTYLNKGEV